ncbi:sulfatase-like hydrolase/transferase, partial [bacterium]|nr:sulfatase-like hydrolase/transferase [bacterium]
NKTWTAGQRTEDDAKVYAAFLHMVDRQVGEIIALLKQLKIDDTTVFFLCGDNGGQDYFKDDEHPHGFFGPNLNPLTGERFRAGKGSLYEGGLKVPFLVRWPGKIKADSSSDHLLYFPDVMPTLAALTHSDCPKTDGVSFLPSLLGRGRQQQHKYFYWEYQGQTAVRMNQWKAYKGRKGDWELYDLSRDIEERSNLAVMELPILSRLIEIAEVAHEPVDPGEIYSRTLIEKDRRQAPH